MLPFVSQVTENQPKYRSIWISGGGGKYVSNHLCIVKIKSNRHWMKSFNLSPEKKSSANTILESTAFDELDFKRFRSVG